MTEDAAEIFCPACGYNLRGIASERCPECGLALDRAQLNRSQLPWTYRHEIGRVRAYLKTVLLVLARPRRVGEEVARPVSLEDARRFRHITVMIAFVPVMAAITWQLFVIKHDIRATMTRPIPSSINQQPAGVTWPAAAVVAPTHAWIGWTLETGLLPIVAFSAWLFLYACSGVASWFFHPPSLSIPRQNRAIALSYYSSAAMAIMPASLAIVIQILLTATSPIARRFLPYIVLLGFLALIPVYQLFQSYLVPMRMLRRATQATTARVWTMGAILPLTWALLGIVILIGIPLAYLYVSIVMISFLP